MDQIIVLLSELEDIRRAACKLAPELPQDVPIRALYLHAKQSSYSDTHLAEDFDEHFSKASRHSKPVRLLWTEYQRALAALQHLLKDAP